MKTNIVIKRGSRWTVIRDVEEVEIPYICPTCGHCDHIRITVIAAHPFIECSLCLNEMVLATNAEVKEEQCHH